MSSCPTELAPAALPAAACWPLVVVGAGAAGLTAARFAAQAGAKVLLLDGRARPCAKIRVSGGGRCNVLPSAFVPQDFHSHRAREVLEQVLASWPLAAVTRYFTEELGVPLKREATGKMFPVSNSSRDVVTALLADVARAGVILQAGDAVARLSRCRPADAAQAPSGPRFCLHLASGAQVLARSVLLATGGLSMPKTGSNGSGWGFARALGHTVLPCAPALVPLLAPVPAAWSEALAGLSLPATLRCAGLQAAAGVAVHGDFLFTHVGYSGPAVLDVSRHFTAAAAPDAYLRAQWVLHDATPQAAALALTQTFAQAGTQSVQSLLRALVPRRLADALLVRALGEEGAQAVAGRRACELAKKLRQQIVAQLVACPLPVAGSEGYRTAEVTAGGVALDEVVASSLESRLHAGLYFAGETLDVTGKLGGYNFLWAWTSGRVSGRAAGQALRMMSQGAI